jgi:hypothetical protein
MSIIRRIRRHLARRPRRPRWDDRAIFANLLNQHLLRDVGL